MTRIDQRQYDEARALSVQALDDLGIRDLFDDGMIDEAANRVCAKMVATGLSAKDVMLENTRTNLGFG